MFSPFTFSFHKHCLSGPTTPVSMGQTVPRSTMGARAPTPLGTQAGLRERRTPGARTRPEQGGGLVLGRSRASAVSRPRFFLSLPPPLFGVGFGFRRASGSLGSRAWRWGPHPGIAPFGASGGAQGFCTQRRRVCVVHACGCGCGCGGRAGSAGSAGSPPSAAAAQPGCPRALRSLSPCLAQEVGCVGPAGSHPHPVLSGGPDLPPGS